MKMVEKEIQIGRPFKLDEKTVDEIVDRFNKGETIRGLAKEYGVSAPTVSRYIKSRQP